MQKSIKNLSGL